MSSVKAFTCDLRTHIHPCTWEGTVHQVIAHPSYVKHGNANITPEPTLSFRFQIKRHLYSSSGWLWTRGASIYVVLWLVAQSGLARTRPRHLGNHVFILHLDAYSPQGFSTRLPWILISMSAMTEDHPQWSIPSEAHPLAASTFNADQSNSKSPRSSFSAAFVKLVMQELTFPFRYSRSWMLVTHCWLHYFPTNW